MRQRSTFTTRPSDATWRPMVRSAGGVLVRRAERENGGLEVAVVHSPKKKDWSFPKGKIEEKETIETCALREVWEETGFHAELGPRLTSQRYVDYKGRYKEVFLFLMWRKEGAFQPSGEVDELAWCTFATAESLLSHEVDREVLREARALLKM